MKVGHVVLDMQKTELDGRIFCKKRNEGRESPKPRFFEHLESSNLAFCEQVPSESLSSLRPLVTPIFSVVPGLCYVVGFVQSWTWARSQVRVWVWFRTELAKYYSPAQELKTVLYVWKKNLLKNRLNTLPTLNKQALGIAASSRCLKSWKKTIESTPSDRLRM